MADVSTRWPQYRPTQQKVACNSGGGAGIQKENAEINRYVIRTGKEIHVPVIVMIQRRYIRNALRNINKYNKPIT